MDYGKQPPLPTRRFRLDLVRYKHVGHRRTHSWAMLTIGIEPITQREQILSLSCLPISPSELRKWPHSWPIVMWSQTGYHCAVTNYTKPSEASGSSAAAVVGSLPPKILTSCSKFRGSVTVAGTASQSLIAQGKCCFMAN